MDVNRRQFIQISGATAAGLAVAGLGFDLKPVKAHAGMLKTKYAKETDHHLLLLCGGLRRHRAHQQKG
jgi:anaerobic selenocysteine-containing dehydrogenase